MRSKNPPNSYIERELTMRARALETLCSDYERILNTYPAGPARLKAVESYDTSHPWSIPTVHKQGCDYYDVNKLRATRYANQQCHPLHEY